MFNEDDFMNNTTEGEMSTEFTPIPEGEFQAFIKGVKVRSGVSEKTGSEWAVLDVTWSIDDAGVAEETGLDNPTCRQSVFLDLTPEGGLDYGKGKNIQLGRLREAVGQNSGAWSPSMLEGSAAIVKVEHRIYEGKTFADVKGASAV